NLEGRDIRDLALAKETQDPEEKARIALLAQALIYGGYVDPNWFQFLSMTMVNLSLTHGSSAGSALGYVTYGVLLGGAFGDYATAHEFGKAAIALGERFDDLNARSIVRFYFGAFVNPWRSPVRTSVAPLDEAYVGCLDSGSFVYAGLCALQSLLLRLLRGEELYALLESAQKHFEQQRRLNQMDAAYFIAIF